MVQLTEGPGTWRKYLSQPVHSCKHSLANSHHGIVWQR
jgi:hypothetical protein